MVMVPTSGDIRQARADGARVWAACADTVAGPWLASLGAAATALRTVAQPVVSLASWSGLKRLEPVTDVLDGAAPPLELPASNNVDFASEQAPGITPRVGSSSGSGWPPGRAPAQTRAGIYGELAWRGWNVLHRLGAQPAVAALLRELRTIEQRSARAIEQGIDELHDGSEEVLGHLSLGVERARSRVVNTLN